MRLSIIERKRLLGLAIENTAKIEKLMQDSYRRIELANKTIESEQDFLNRAEIEYLKGKDLIAQLELKLVS